MSDVPNSSFPYPALREAERPKGSHLYRVFSLTNHAPMKLFHREQLLAWTMLEFDPAVVSFEAINRWFDHVSGAIYVGYYVRYMEYDCFMYIPNPTRIESLKSFEKYAKSFNVKISPMLSEKTPQNDTLFWNRMSMLSVLVSERDKLSSRNLSQFSRSIENYGVTIGELEQMPDYVGQEALAYAFELVRKGHFTISGLKDELLQKSSVLRIAKSVKR